MFAVKLCAALIGAILLFTACSGKTIKIYPTDDFTMKARSRRDATLAELERQRSLWRESRIADYNFKVSFLSSTWAGAFVKVRQGKVRSIEKNPKDALGEMYDYEKLATIEKMFDFIREEAGSDRIVETKYDPQFGLPQRIVISNSSAIDDQSFYEISNFEIVSPAFEAEAQEKFEETFAELNKNRLLWQENKISDYDFVCKQFRGGNYGYPAALVKVRNNQPFALELPQNLDLTMARIDDYDKMGSFEKMFEVIEQELNNGRILTVRYSKLGYPQKFDIEYFYGTHGSKRVEISKFELVK